jgi:hypothetical protein
LPSKPQNEASESWAKLGTLGLICQIESERYLGVSINGGIPKMDGLWKPLFGSFDSLIADIAVGVFVFELHLIDEKESK